MSITYHGRQMPCFWQRQTHLGGCDKNATHRAESSHVIIHVCDTHAETLREGGTEYAFTSLAPLDAVDEIPAVSMDPKDLARAPQRYSTQYACTNCGCRLETGEERYHGGEWNRRASLHSDAPPEREPPTREEIAKLVFLARDVTHQPWHFGTGDEMHYRREYAAADAILALFASASSSTTTSQT